jgi:hypothetical protein
MLRRAELTFIAGDPAKTGASMGAIYARLRASRGKAVCRRSPN